MTTLCFEASDEDDLRRTRFSAELQRIPYREKARPSAKRAIELTQTMYALDFRLPDSKWAASVNIVNDPEPKRLLEILKADW